MSSVTKGARIELDDGRLIRVTGRPVQGTRHEVLFGVVEATGEKVAVKLERISGSLACEKQALSWLTAKHGPSPRLLGATGARYNTERVYCLVTDRAPGNTPITAQAWVRMGRAIAGLTRIDWDGSGLAVLDAFEFGHAHRRRINELDEALSEIRATVEDWEQLSSWRVPRCSSTLVFTHGDPGPGNYLDDGASTGVLIDWEDAHVAPIGLDLARAIFIALLGAGPSGYVAQDQEEHAEAVTRGYLDQLKGQWQPTRDELRWWVTVAGIQFIHRRYQHGGEPGVSPWQEAAHMLSVALTAPSRPEGSAKQR